MNLNRYYGWLYRVGLTPWEQDGESIGAQLDAILAHEEGGRTPPFGRALDLGCGTGRWSIELSRRGWQVTGIDVVARAVDAARRRARLAGDDVMFVEGDVTALREVGVGSGFSLLLDVECFNHLEDAQRLAVGREVDSAASDDAAILLLGWARARRGPAAAGSGRSWLGGCVSGVGYRSGVALRGGASTATEADRSPLVPADAFLSRLDSERRTATPQASRRARPSADG